MPYPLTRSGPGDRLCETAEAQEQDSSGRKGTREKAQLARWLGVLPQMEPSVPGPWPPGRGREAWHQISVGLCGSAAEMCRGGNCILHGQCLLLPDSSVCISRFHEPRLGDGCLGPDYIQTFSASSVAPHLIIMTAFSAI